MGLPGDYIAGLVDGEGCFSLQYNREIKHARKGKPVYFRWEAQFAMGLSEDGRAILEEMQATLGCGKVYKCKARRIQRPLAIFVVYAIEKLWEKVIPFFEKYPLRAKKRHDFELWKQAVEVLWHNNGKYATKAIQQTDEYKEDQATLEGIYLAMRQYKAKGRGSKWLAKDG